MPARLSPVRQTRWLTMQETPVRKPSFAQRQANPNKNKPLGDAQSGCQTKRKSDGILQRH
jgi:hypothetical protein